MTGSRFSVLVVDNDPVNRTLIENFLIEGFDSPFIIHAESLAQGKRHLKSEEIIGAIVTGISDYKFVEELVAIATNIPITVIAPKISIKKSPNVDYLLKKELSAFQLFKSISYGVHRAQEQEKMRQAADNNRIFFLQSPVPKWIYDSKTLRFIDVNNAAISLYGYSRDELLSMSLVDISDPAVEKVTHKGTTRHVKKNGEIIDVQVDASLIEYEGRKVRLAVCIDITGQLKADRALRANERRFKALIQSGGDLITILSPEGEIKYTSPNHETILGYKKDALIGQNIADFIHPEDYEETISLYKTLQTRRRAFSSTFRFLNAKKQWVWLESIASNSLRDESIKGFVVNSRDVTERVENEARLQKSNDRFEAIVKAASDAIYDHNLATRKIFIAGSNYHTLFGYQFEDHITDVDFYKSCIHPDDRDKVFNFLSKSVLNPKKTHFELEYRLRRHNGTYATILDRYNVIWENGVASRKIGAMQDISSRKFHENMLAFEREIYELNTNPKISFDYVVNKLATNIEELISGSVCTIASVDEDMNLHHMAGASVSEDYVRALNSIKLEANSGSFAVAIRTGKNCFSDNVDQDPAWRDYLNLTQPYGYHSCWAAPVKKRSGKTMAILVLYLNEHRLPSKEETSLLERITNLIGVLIENRSALEETETAKERYDIVAKATSDTIWDWKIQEDDFSWNKGIQGVFGYKRDQIGKTSKWWFDRIHPEDSIRLSVKLYNFLEEKVEKWQDEYRFKCADGTYKYVFDRGFLVKDKDGRPVRMITSMQDVTKQKQEEQRLKLLETVVTQTKDSVIITESEKSGRSIPKIVFVNPAFTSMTGYKASEVVGKSPAIFMGRKSVAHEIARLTQALRNKKEFKFETLNHKKNGEEYWINFSMIPITNKEGEHSHWISIQRDITEEKKQEKEKEQLIRELTQNNKDLKQFSYITSHNLRAPLSNLTGLLELIKDIPVENAELRELLNGFIKSTHLLNETINDLVKVVIIKDNPSIEKEEVLINDVFENVFNQLSVLISANKPIIRFSFEKIKILNINKSYLESILLNLLTNAIKYRSPSRQLRISIKTKAVGDSVVLTFKDNGIGIDLKRNADKIFGLYQRFHDYPDSKGLGLYLVKSQVEAMGGTISVQSEVNKGTTFTLTFKTN